MTTIATSPVAVRAPASDAGVAPVTRVTSIDAFRGFVMFLMLAEAMRLWTLHNAFPASRFWAPCSTELKASSFANPVSASERGSTSPSVAYLARSPTERT